MEQRHSSSKHASCQGAKKLQHKIFLWKGTKTFEYTELELIQRNRTNSSPTILRVEVYAKILSNIAKRINKITVKSRF